MDKNHANNDGQGLKAQGSSVEDRADDLADCRQASGDYRRPVVSIVMPVHNQEQVLRETLDSIAQQTFRNYELICVDDGSTDGSLDIECEYAARDERIRLFQREQQGAAPARNFGLSKAVGTFVIFLDSDDLFVPHFFEKMVDALERTGADVCVCGWESFFTDGVEPGVRRCEDRSDGPKSHGYPVDSDYPSHRGRSNHPSQRTKPVKPSKHYKEGFYNRRDFGQETFKIGGGMAWDKMFHLEHILKCGATFQDVRCWNDCLFTAKAMWAAKTVYLIDDSLVLYRRGLGTSIQDTKRLAIIDVASVAEEIYDQIYDEESFTPDETLGIQQRCVSLLSGAAIGMASAGAYDNVLHERVQSDLRKWGVMDLPAIRLGDSKDALKLMLLKYASSDDVAWVFKNWGLPRDERHTFKQKAGLGVKIAIAISKGRIRDVSAKVAQRRPLR